MRINVEGYVNEYDCGIKYYNYTGTVNGKKFKAILSYGEGRSLSVFGDNLTKEEHDAVEEEMKYI